MSVEVVTQIWLYLRDSVGRNCKTDVTVLISISWLKL